VIEGLISESEKSSLAHFQPMPIGPGIFTDIMLKVHRPVCTAVASPMTLSIFLVIREFGG
jgi:hypothetical protein